MEIHQTVIRKRGRPPKRPEDALETRELLVRAGLEVLTEKGFAATGIDEVLKRVGVPKGSFYHYFDSKEAFAQQALEHVYAPRLARYAQALGDSRFSPRERVLRYYGELLEHFARQEKPEYHCFIGSLSFEMAELSPAIGAQVDAILQRSADILQACLEEAQRAGELPEDEDCANLAGFIANAWQGVLTRLKVGAGARPLFDFMTRLQRLLRV